MPGFAFGSDDVTSGKGPNPSVNTARTYRWRIIKLGPVSASTISGVSTQWYAKSLTFPTLGANIEEATGSTVKYKFAGHVNYTNANITFYNVLYGSGTSVQAFLENWARSIYGHPISGNPKNIDFNAVHVADDYKDTSIFSLRDESGGDKTTLILHNSWPLKVSHTALDYSKNELAEVSLELVFDWYSLESSNETSSGDGPSEEFLEQQRAISAAASRNR